MTRLSKLDYHICQRQLSVNDFQHTCHMVLKISILNKYLHHSPPSQVEPGKICKQFFFLQAHHHDTREHLKKKTTLIRDVFIVYRGVR